MASNLKEKGGFLTLEVELGPTDDELEDLKKGFEDLLPYAKKQALAEKRAKGENPKEEDWEEDDDLSENEFQLVPVEFKDGKVRLLVLGEDGSVTNPESQISVVGSTKPSLYGKQTAVFSVRLTGDDADLMYQMLTAGKKIGEENSDSTSNSDDNDSQFIQSHIAVVYDLTFKGIEPAHYVKIFIDFEAVEDFWDHHGELHGNFDYGKGETQSNKSSSNSDKYKISVFADVDLDFMYRTLINEGKIIVQHIDFTGKNEGSPLSADDPSAIELVKKLMSAELFEPATLPKEDYSALKDVSKATGTVVDAIAGIKNDDGKPEKDTKGQEQQKPSGEGQQKPSGEGQQKPSGEGQQKPSGEGQQKPSGEGQQKPSGDGKTPAKPKTEFPTFLSLAGEDKKIYKDEWLKSKFDEKDFEKYAVHKEYVNEEKYKPLFTVKRKKDKRFPTFTQAAGEDNLIDYDEWLKAGCTKEEWSEHAIKETYVGEEQYNKFVEDKKKADEQECPDDKPTNTPEKVPTKESEESEVNAIEWNLGVKLGYSLKRRKTNETKTRTYIFNKQMAVDHEIHPSGMLSVTGTKFDLQKQVTEGRLGEGPFRTHEIYFGTSMDFDAYQLQKILIDVNHKDTTGKVIELTKEKTSDKFYFDCENFNVDPENIQEEPDGQTLTEEKLKAQAEKKKKEDEDAYNSGKKLKYKVTFVFKSLSIIGFGAGKDIVQIVTDYKYASGKTFMIGPDDINGIYPLKLQTGSLSLDKGIKSANVYLSQVPESTDGEQKENQVYYGILKSDSNVLLLLNPEHHYKVHVNYNLNNPYNDKPINQVSLNFTSDVLATREFVIEDPTKGITLIRTIDGEDTFGSIRSITVTLMKGNKEVQFKLSKNTPEYYFVTDYKEGDSEEIIVKSVKINYRDSDPKDFTPDITKFLTSATVYELDL